MPDALGLQLAPVNATGPDDLEQAFAALMEEQVQACVLLANTVLFNNRLSIAEMALANRLPGISDAVEFVEAGFLLVYGVQIRDLVASLPFTSTRSSREKPGE